MRPDESFISQPIRDLQTMLRVLAQDDPNHPDVIPDGIYGPDTVKAVSAFQKMHGLPVTGVTDLDTWEAIFAHHHDARIRQAQAYPLQIQLDPGEEIQKGQRHPNLLLIQAMLTLLSIVYGSIGAPSQNGVLDEITADSIASFQLLSSLPPTGRVDKITWKHLALQYPLAAALNNGRGKQAAVRDNLR